MPIVFKQPLFLILLLLLPVVILWSRKYPFPGLSPKRKAISLALRCLILVLLISSLAGLSIKKSVDEISTIFAIDHSDSVTSKGKEKASRFVGNALTGTGNKNTAGVVVFGADALVERYPTNNNELGYISSTPKTDLTNIAEALNLSTIMFPQDSRKHLVLLSDGNESVGDIDDALKLLTLNNIRLSAVLLPSLEKREVIMTSLRTPSFARVGEKFNATVKVDSDVQTGGRLQVFQDEELVKSTYVQIEKGINEYAFELQAKSSGFKRFKAQIEPGIDHWAENNEAHSITMVEGPPNILIVEGTAGEAVNLAAALKNSSIHTTLATPADIPVKAAQLANYQAIVLANVSAEQLGDDKMKAIKSYVRDAGGGLVVIGGG
ncbi:MAG TPA: vWA domain-containing protein, partial [Anaerolineae bacterium]|nr:vWA domain-containing protein [Anaerolineae bacterium]